MNKVQPKISIITVCFNAGKTIEETFKSVLNQTYSNIEYIVIDGGSTDNTLEIINRYKNRLSYFISERDSGIYDAMNKGLKIANGDWLYFLGGDDILNSPETMLEVAPYLLKNDVAYYGKVLFKGTKEVYKFDLSTWKLAYRNISHQSIFYPKQYYKSNLYNLTYRTYSDHIYNINLHSSGSCRFEYIDHLIAIYNDAGASSIIFDKMYYMDLPNIVYQKLGLQYAIYVKFRVALFKFKRSLQRK